MQSSKSVLTSLILLLSLSNPAAQAAMETCNPPDFSYSWLGYDLVKITAKADPAQTFVVTLSYLEPPKGGWEICTDKDKKRNCFDPIFLLPATAKGTAAECDTLPATDGLKEGVQFCINATPGGSTASLVMDREALLKSGGFAGLSYRALTKERASACEERRQGPDDPAVKILDKHNLSFDIGSVFNLQGDGGWETNAEAAVVSRSQWYEFLQTGFSLRYSAIGAVDESDDDGEEGEEEEDKADDEDEEFNPFTTGGGVLETNVYVMLSPRSVPRLGLIGGWGLSSIPGEADSRLETRNRWFVGLRNSIQAFNSGRSGDSLENSAGYIQAGWATDDLWERVEIKPASEDGAPAVISDESERYFFEGELELPRIGTEWFRINLRFFASVPRSGDGPSDVRVSALGSIDPRRWFPNAARDN